MRFPIFCVVFAICSAAAATTIADDTRFVISNTVDESSYACHNPKGGTVGTCGGEVASCPPVPLPPKALSLSTAATIHQKHVREEKEMITVPTVASTLMKVMETRMSRVAYPTGDKSFAVMQAFPAAFRPEESDPFLMCDKFGPTLSEGAIQDPDEFPINWHPHRGMDLVTYLLEGVGRHADSMGNRKSFASPGMQWCSAGSGIEHAEGGGTPSGQNTTGFQIWINVPSSEKMKDPRYGTEPPENIPTLKIEGGVTCRLLAGSMNGGTVAGPFTTVTPVHMADFALGANKATVHTAEPDELDNCLVLCYQGSGDVNGAAVTENAVVRLDAGVKGQRSVKISSGPSGAGFLFFCGKRLNEKVAWRGPIVMNTDKEIETTFDELRRGTFLKKRAAWDYRRIATKK